MPASSSFEASPLRLDDAALVLNRSKADALFGKPTDVIKRRDQPDEYEYQFGGIRITFSKSPRSQEQKLTTVRMVDFTPEGIHVGATENEVVSKVKGAKCHYGGRYNLYRTCEANTPAQETAPFNERRTTFDIRDGRITEITIETYTICAE